MSEKKIISLLPAATEIVCALGLGDLLVGISHECDYPPQISSLPRCSSTREHFNRDSLKINETVEQILVNGLSIYEINRQLISELNPDIIITQSQCEVCAVSLNDVEAALKNLLAHHCELISLSPNTLQDIFTDILTISQKLDVEEKGILLIEELNERLDILKHKLKFVEQKPTVACIEWLSPMMTAGNWMPELIQIAGGIPVLAENGKHSPCIEFSRLAAENPDIIIAMPCGFSIEKTIKDIHLLTMQSAWADLKAVKNNSVYIADGNQYFNRSGPRIVDSVEILAEIINPKQFRFGYEGNGWVGFGF